MIQETLSPILILVDIFPTPKIKHRRQGFPHLLTSRLMLRFHLGQALLTDLHRAPLCINLKRVRSLSKFFRLTPIRDLRGPQLACIDAVRRASRLEAEWVRESLLYFPQTFLSCQTQSFITPREHSVSEKVVHGDVCRDVERPREDLRDICLAC